MTVGTAFRWGFMCCFIYYNNEPFSQSHSVRGPAIDSNRTGLESHNYDDINHGFTFKKLSLITVINIMYHRFGYIRFLQTKADGSQNHYTIFKM